VKGEEGGREGGREGKWAGNVFLISVHTTTKQGRATTRGLRGAFLRVKGQENKA